MDYQHKTTRLGNDLLPASKQAVLFIQLCSVLSPLHRLLLYEQQTQQASARCNSIPSHHYSRKFSTTVCRSPFWGILCKALQRKSWWVELHNYMFCSIILKYFLLIYILLCKRFQRIINLFITFLWVFNFFLWVVLFPWEILLYQFFWSHLLYSNYSKMMTHNTFLFAIKESEFVFGLVCYKLLQLTMLFNQVNCHCN